MRRKARPHPQYSGPTWVVLSFAAVMLVAVGMEAVGLSSFGGRSPVEESRPSPAAVGREPHQSTPGAPAPTVTPVPNRPTGVTAVATPVPPTVVPRPTNQPTAVGLMLTSLGLVGKSADLSAPARATVRGRSYESSVVFTCDMVCDSETASVSVVVPPGVTRLNGAAGVLDNAPANDEKGVFTVVLDGKGVWDATVPLGAPEAFDVPVTPGSRVTLSATRPGALTNPILAGVEATTGKTPTLPHLAWLNPQFP